MFDAIARVLAFFYSLPVVGGSYGVAIILLTAAVMMVLMPLTLRATRSTIKMQAIQPKLKALQKEHADDRQTLNQELWKLYQENGINPVGGCLPMLAQLPVFLVLFNVLRGLSRRVSETPYFAISDHARVLAGGQQIPGETFDPRYLSQDSDMYIDLSRDTEMAFGPFDLAAEALDVLQSNILRGIPYVVLILFVVATSFYQQRQVSSRRSGGSMGMNPQQEMILRFLPILSGVWSFVFPAGLVVYWATSNVFRIGQQSYITRRFYGEEEAAAEAAEESATGEGDGATGDNGRSTSDETSTGPKQGRATSKGGGRTTSTSPTSNGESDDDATVSNGSANGESRSAAWERRRQARAAKAQKARPKPSSEPSSRVTPKGTRPSGPKRKRKR